MPAMIDKNCKSCGCRIRVRVADHKRGWGNYCSKSCKATKQAKRGGKYKNYQKRYDKMTNDEYYLATQHPFSSDSLGQE